MSALCPQYAPEMARTRPYSRPSVLAGIDHRTREGRIMAGVRAELTEHVGGSPSATQRVLIERAAQLTLRLAMLEARPSPMDDHAANQYLAWSNSLVRLMARLGMTGAKQRAPSLREHIASRATAA